MAVDRLWHLIGGAADAAVILGVVLINAAWGLGETVVSGRVQPDIVVLDRASGTEREYEIADKSVWLEPGAGQQRPVDADRRDDRDHARVHRGHDDVGVDVLHVADAAEVLADEQRLRELDGAIDEAMAGHASRIDVTLYKDGSLEVSDDGRGMPVWCDPEPTYRFEPPQQARSKRRISCEKAPQHRDLVVEPRTPFGTFRCAKELLVGNRIEIPNDELIANSTATTITVDDASGWPASSSIPNGTIARLPIYPITPGSWSAR